MLLTCEIRRSTTVNMLKRWYESTGEHTLFTTQTEGDDIMLWDDRGDEDPSISEHLTTEQRLSLQQLIEDFRDVFNNEPGRTTLAEHQIKTGSAKPVRQRTYRLPHAYRETVQKELTGMKNNEVTA